MARFKYKAKDSSGKTIKGLVEAITPKQAAKLLHDRGFFIITLNEISTSNLAFHITGGKISFNDLVHFTRQLSTMLNAGLTLAESLNVLQKQLTKPGLLKLVNQLEDDVRGGKSFADALLKHSDIFPTAYLALVRAGEASGKLDLILLRLADNLEKSRDFKNKVKGAFIYPVIVMAGMIVVVILVITIVIPRLTNLYKEFGVDLPLPTKILIALSDFTTSYWWLIIIIFFVGSFILLNLSRTTYGKFLIANILLRFPIFGPLIRQATLVEVTRTLSILVDGGVPILNSLDISREVAGNILYKKAFEKARKKVEKGSPLSEPLIENELFPPILGQMVSVGEQTGKLGESLLKLSRYFEAEAEVAIRTLTTVIEPLIMISLGLGVGFLVIAVLLPIYSLTSKF